MTKKWVQAEDGSDRPLDIYVLVDEPEVMGMTERLHDGEAIVLLGPDGRPLKPTRHPMGFRKP